MDNASNNNSKCCDSDYQTNHLVKSERCTESQRNTSRAEKRKKRRRRNKDFRNILNNEKGLKMYYLAIIISVLLSNFAFGQELQEQDYKVANEFHYSRLALKIAHKRALSRTNQEAIKQQVYADIDNGRFAQRIDSAVDMIIKRTDYALRAKGFSADADEIMSEYQDHAFFLSRKRGDIGDYAAWSEFMVKVHAKAHEKLGDTLCKWLHVHDLFIITYGVPVAFAPADFDLETYQNHFTGIHILGPFWKHYGLAPVVVYWAVNIVCNASSSGLAAFACSPIATVAEQGFGIYLSPPLGEKIWTKAQN